MDAPGTRGSVISYPASNLRNHLGETRMSIESTQKTLQAYADVLIKRGAYGKYFSDDCTFTLMGSDQVFKGPAAVEGFIRFLHEQAFDANPELVSLICGDGQASLEAKFIGTHTGEFFGVSATGRHVEVPYSVFYDVKGEKLTALRAYMPVDVLMGQLKSAQPAAA